MFFGQGDHLIQANPSNEFYALLFRETKTSNADDAAVFLASFTSTESSCVKNLRHYFLKLSMEMVSDIHWSEICLDIWGIISWNGVRRDIHWKYLKHLIWLTSLEWWLVRGSSPHGLTSAIFGFVNCHNSARPIYVFMNRRVDHVLTCSYHILRRFAKVPTGGITYKKEQMRVM